MIDLKSLANASVGFKAAKPFHHIIIDNLFEKDCALSLEREFPSYDSAEWYTYRNQIEDKKTLNNWHTFGPLTYKCFAYLCSSEFTTALSEICGVELFPDIGLHGGGWHIHGEGGNLNPHLDYSIHPKLGLQRKVNIIIYLSSDLRPEHGGQLGLWEQDESANLPSKLIKEIEPKFNRAVIFDTTQNSWHGMSRPLVAPKGVFRKSLAAYYLCAPPAGTDPRAKALFAPRESQKANKDVLDLIEKRSNLRTAPDVYRK